MENTKASKFIPVGTFLFAALLAVLNSSGVSGLFSLALQTADPNDFSVVVDGPIHGEVTVSRVAATSDNVLFAFKGDNITLKIATPKATVTCEESPDVTINLECFTGSTLQANGKGQDLHHNKKNPPGTSSRYRNQFHGAILFLLYPCEEVCTYTQILVGETWSHDAGGDGTFEKTWGLLGAPYIDAKKDAKFTDEALAVKRFDNICLFMDTPSPFPKISPNEGTLPQFLPLPIDSAPTLNIGDTLTVVRFFKTYFRCPCEDLEDFKTGGEDDSGLPILFVVEWNCLIEYVIGEKGTDTTAKRVGIVKQKIRVGDTGADKVTPLDKEQFIAAKKTIQSVLKKKDQKDVFKLLP